ncbi:hypothetical protein GBA52_013528 [Prunus armeniaca]|nr:hypothetical protein GBA52_013528 [Prunus armeniaca]
MAPERAPKQPPTISYTRTDRQVNYDTSASKIFTKATPTELPKFLPRHCRKSKGPLPFPCRTARVGHNQIRAHKILNLAKHNSLVDRLCQKPGTHENHPAEACLANH